MCTQDEHKAQVKGQAAIFFVSFAGVCVFASLKPRYLSLRAENKPFVF